MIVNPGYYQDNYSPGASYAAKIIPPLYIRLNIYIVRASYKNQRDDFVFCPLNKF